jgi:hypothetical protein
VTDILQGLAEERFYTRKKRSRLRDQEKGGCKKERAEVGM